MKAILVVLLMLFAMLAGCAGGVKDTDGDLLSDTTELRGWPITVDLLGQRVTRVVTSDPELRDSDGDGLPDDVEFQFPGGLDPSSKDTDEDGLTDCQESLHSVAADCENPDFNGPYDGGTRTSANNADSEPGGRYYRLWAVYKDATGTVNDVTWGDGIPDGQEYQGYMTTIMGQERFVKTRADKADTDDDGLEDGEEHYIFHTDPTVKDTDGDGCMDGRDPVPDRNETYSPGLQTLQLNRAGPTGTAHVRFHMDFWGPAQIPAQGTITAPQGQNVDISRFNPEPFRPAGCTLPTVPGRLSLQIAAANTDAGGGFLDLFSLSHPEYDGKGVATLYWNIREGTFSFYADGRDATQGPVRLSGYDGQVTLTPRAS